MRCPTEGALLGSASPVSPPHWPRVSPIALVMSLGSLKSHRTVTSLQSRTGEAPGCTTARCTHSTPSLLSPDPHAGASASRALLVLCPFLGAPGTPFSSSLPDQVYISPSPRSLPGQPQIPELSERSLCCPRLHGAVSPAQGWVLRERANERTNE